MQLEDCCIIAAPAFLPTAKYLLSALYPEKMHGACLQLPKFLPEVLFFLSSCFFNYHANTVVCTVSMMGIGSL